jgi:hypothetical protein
VRTLSDRPGKHLVARPVRSLEERQGILRGGELIDSVASVAGGDGNARGIARARTG